VFAEEGVGRRLHGAEVELVDDVPGQPGQQGIGHRGVDHQVTVAAGDGRVAGVEAVGGHLRLPHHDGRGQLAVAGLDQGHRIEPGRPVGRDVEVDHLVHGVDPGVGAAGTGQLHRGAADPGQGGLQGPGHRRLPVLGREPVEAGTVVGQGQPPPDGPLRQPPGVGGRAHTNSMRAIGALSPSRFPSLRIRVYPPGRSA
jgi:hypothetical protein